jgi:serine/threonine protein kinase
MIPESEMAFVTSVRAIIIFCNIFNSKELENALLLNSCVTELGDEAPPTILVPHTDPEKRTTDNPGDEFHVLSEAMSAGIDCTLTGEPEGMKLVCLIRAEIFSQENSVFFFNKALNQHRRKIQQVQEIEDCVEETLWDYLRVRLNTQIPRPDYDIDVCKPGSRIGEFRVSKQLGEGGSGTVFALEDFDAPASPTSECSSSRRKMSEEGGRFSSPSRPVDAQVLKTISKASKANINGLKSLSNEILIMEMLSAKWKHPNIVKLHEVYHSETHILLRMEDGGPVDLYKCLRAHEIGGVPLGSAKAEKVILEAAKAVCHLHLGPKIVHRDIKPENIIARETPEDITVKLCDFDLARIMPKAGKSSFLGGTFPFMAPEMLEQQSYDPFPTDIWSLGIVCLEVLCCCGVLAKALAFPRLANYDPNRKAKEKAMTKDISNLFVESGSLNLLLGKFHAGGLGDLVKGPIAEILDNHKGMLCVEASKRMTAVKLRERIKLLEEERVAM